MNRAVPGPTRDLYGAVVDWARRRRILVDLEALAVVVLVVRSRISMRWTATEARRLVLIEIPHWCAREKLEVPANAAGSALLFAGYLAEQGGLRPDTYQAVAAALAPLVRRGMHANADRTNVVALPRNRGFSRPVPTRARDRPR